MERLDACLEATLSGDPNVRAHAEHALQTGALCANDPNGAFGVQLAQILAQSSAPLSMRQAAGIALKKYIYERWSIYFETFLRDAKAADAAGTGEAIPVETKQVIHSLLLQALGDATRKVRLLAAQLLSIVCLCDFPDEFQDLLPALKRKLQAHSAPDATFQLEGALKFLSEFVQVELDENQLFVVSREFVPLLQEIMDVNSSVLSPMIKAQSLLVFRECLLSLYMVRGTFSAVVDQAVLHYLPPWLLAMLQMLDTASLDATSPESLGLRREIFRTLGVASKFRKLFSEPGPALLSACIANLEALLPAFTQFELEAEPKSLPTIAEGSADVACDIPQLAMAAFTLFSETLESAPMRALLLEGGSGGDGELTRQCVQLVQLTIAFAQITRDDEETFEDDPSAFVQEDDEENMLITLRTSTTDLVDQLLDAYPLPVLRMLPNIVAQIEQQSNAHHGPTWWKPVEALLMLLGAVHHAIEDVLDSTSALNLLHPSHVVERLVLPNLHANTPPFLRGRCFVFASQNAEALGETLAREVFASALHVIHAHEAPLHLKLSAVRAVRNFGNLTQVSVEEARAVLQSLGPLMLDAAGSPLVLIMDAVESAIPRAKFTDGDARILYDIARATMTSWRASTADPQVEISVAALMEALVQSKVEGVAAAAAQLGLQSAANALQEDTDYTGLGASAASLARSILQVCAAEMAPQLISLFFPPAAAYLLRTDDMEAAQNLLYCVTLLWQKAPGVLLQWHDRHTGALDLILHIVQRQLTWEDEAACGMSLGTLLTTMFLQSSHDASMQALQAIMPGMIRALAEKLAVARNIDCILGILFPLAYLFAEHTEAILSLLHGMQVGTQNALVLVVTKWLADVGHVVGPAMLRVHILGLGRLLEHWPAALGDVRVEGALLPSTGDGTRFTILTEAIITRSRAKSMQLYEMIPANAKLVQLLVQDWQRAAMQDEEKSASPKLTAAMLANAEGKDDDEWESDEEATARDEMRSKFLNDLYNTGVLDDDEEDGGALGPIEALPQFSHIAHMDKAFQNALPVLSAVERDAVQLLGRLLAAPELIGSIHVLTPPDVEHTWGAKRMRTSPVKFLATQKGVPALHIPHGGLDALVLPASIATSPAPLLVTASFGHRIPSSLLTCFHNASQTLNLHPSLLPRLRGAAPIQWAIARGYSETGVSVQQLHNEHFDRGALLAQATIRIPPDSTYTAMLPVLAEHGAQLLTDTIAHLPARDASKLPQDDALATRAPKLKRAYTTVKWHVWDADMLDARLRGFGAIQPLTTMLIPSNPAFPMVGCAFYQGKAMQTSLQLASPQAYQALYKFDARPGHATYAPELDAVVVRCTMADTRESVFAIKKLQTQGKPARNAAEWWRGFSDRADTHGRILFAEGDP
ncbi:hypothetical protein MVES1_003381 [Malassezia vespertilionis]|uniref:uncharacterized protein n=1 Tax=Malassezia vespertilionis TaxID=2020962 RepID=UPI0024B1A28C|nr:uncharacterized protein MVES1_003381 [Malassezia vespertilionis]WFD08012.1 hypothetical protein MVES1_003381 [Malassezia vespertilionis]